MITHLSAPAGQSVNDFISRDSYSLRYATVDNAIAMIQRHGRGALMAKTDVKHAFRLIPVHPLDWPLLGIKWENQYYVDKCLPFGLRSAPFLFNRLAEAFEWVLRHNYGIEDTLHYLDDFFTVGPPLSPGCQRKLSIIRSVAANLGLPLAPEKTEGPATTLSFLGIELDSVKGRARLPPDKLSELQQLAEAWRQRRKCTKRQLLRLIGKLSFATKVVPAGRIFLRRLIDASTTVARLGHRISLTRDTRADLAWWQEFLPTWPGVALFLEGPWVPAPTLHLYTDAAGAIGYGAYFQGAWLSELWLPTPAARCRWHQHRMAGVVRHSSSSLVMGPKTAAQEGHHAHRQHGDHPSMGMHLVLRHSHYAADPHPLPTRSAGELYVRIGTYSRCQQRHCRFSLPQTDGQVPWGRPRCRRPAHPAPTRARPASHTRAAAIPVGKLRPSFPANTYYADAITAVCQRPPARPTRSLSGLIADSQRHQLNALAPSTRRTYGVGIRSFFQFCRSHHQSPPPPPVRGACKMLPRITSHCHHMAHSTSLHIRDPNVLHRARVL